MNDLAIVQDIHTRTQPKAISRHAATGARIFMGLLFLVTGLNGLFQFLPRPANAMPVGAEALSNALMQSGYLVELVGVTQAVVGALLLANRFVPLALTVLAPVVINIVAFHAFLAPQGLALAIVVLALEAYLAFVNRNAFRALFAARN